MRWDEHVGGMAAVGVKALKKKDVWPKQNVRSQNTIMLQEGMGGMNSWQRFSRGTWAQLSLTSHAVVCGFCTLIVPNSLLLELHAIAHLYVL
jgi:hypothetical protein